jgi:hypothetical protein
MMKKKQGISYYTLTEEIIRRRLSPHSIPLECVKCRRELHIGDRIVRRRRLLYHEQCYESTFIDIPDNFDLEEQYFIEYGYYLSTISATIPTNILKE